MRVLGLFRRPFHPEPIGGMVKPQSSPGTIYNSSPGRPSPGEVVHMARCGYCPCQWVVFSGVSGINNVIIGAVQKCSKKRKHFGI